MSSRDWFMLVVRILGVWVLYMSVTYIASYVDYCLGFRHDSPSDSGKGFLVHGCINMCLALYLLLGTKHLAKLTYGDDTILPTALQSRESTAAATESRNNSAN